MKKYNSINDNKKERVAFVICSNVIGGHEFQSRALVDDFAKHVEVTVFLNSHDQEEIFASAPASKKIYSGLFFKNGWIVKQLLLSLTLARRIRKTLSGFDRVIVCAGAVEAGICTSLALWGKKNIVLYLPFFYDRTTIWGKCGCIYNALLSLFGRFYDHVIVINRIQAKLIKGFLGKPTSVIPNLIENVPRAEKGGAGRILFIGRLDRQKRLPELLQLLDFAENPYREVLIMGDGPEKVSVARKIAEMKNIKASLLGWKTTAEQTDIIEGNDILILNSAIEGEPMVIREAHNRGISVIARDIPGVRLVTRKSNRFLNGEQLKKIILNSSSGNLPPYYKDKISSFDTSRSKAIKSFLS